VEREWLFTHEDLLTNWGGVVGGFPANILRERNHGTAVVGILGGDTNPLGIKGICPDAMVSGISTRTPGLSATTSPGTIETSAAIRQAALTVGPGDIILLELQREGPPFVTGTKQIAVEWWPDDFDAILYATTLGRIVVEAAGNGFVNLDDSLYDAPASTFPSGWTNPFKRANRDSGAIIVGAGAPPSGGFGPDRSRLDFSNFGQSLDAQGWGRRVFTTGYGCLQGGIDEKRWYMDQFGGTSAASAMVAGVLACVQGHRRAASQPLLTPSEARSLLRTTGSPQTDAPTRPKTQHIGKRPDLKALIPKAKRPASRPKKPGRLLPKKRSRKRKRSDGARP
jgi:subtilisin family serine protease